MSALRRFARLRAMRALVVALTFALGSAGTLPLWATLLGIADVHACHCSSDHHDCVCARCHTDPDAGMRVSSETLRNSCGDDETVFGGRRLVATIASEFPRVVVATVSDRTPRLASADFFRSRDATRPATPPPRPHG